MHHPMFTVRPGSPFQTACGDGEGVALVFWWSIQMDAECEINTAPTWIPGHDPNWREHWMPCLFWLPAPVPMTAGQEMVLWSNHDDYRLWFDVSVASEVSMPSHGQAHPLPQPVCSCGLHLCLDESRIWLLNDPTIAQSVSMSVLPFGTELPA